LSNLQRLFLNIRTKFVHILPAQPCLLCGAASPHGAWCSACDAALPYLNTARCPLCALPTLAGAVCGHCLRQPPHFTGTVAAFAYAFPLDQLLQAYKFGEQLQLAHALAERLAQRIELRPDCIIPMPLHSARLRERGFNQSLLLAHHLACKLDIPVLPNACQRVRNTTPQSSLSWRERGKNIRNAFACSAAVAGKHVAVVDDVMTTGASLNELARALKRAGASEVSNWVVARTLPHTARR
jgi:ComF family protein